MNLEELEKKLVEIGIPSHYYSLTGGLINDTLCIEKVNYRWIIYYTEKGIKFDEKGFSNENEACEYFYRLILEDNIIS